MLWSGGNDISCVTFNLSETGKFYNMEEPMGLTTFYYAQDTSVPFSNENNLDMVIGYYNAYKNINLAYLIGGKIPFKMNISDGSQVAGKMLEIGYEGNELFFKYQTSNDPFNFYTFNTLDDESINSIQLDFKKSSKEKDIKYLESRIKELGLKISLFRSSMTLSEYGAVQRQLRKYNELLQNIYLIEHNSDLNNFFESMKSALKLDFGDINKKYVSTDKLSVNGLPSQLTESEWFTVRKEDFKIWFGDWETAYFDQNYSGVSLVIDDATKEPLPVYHGTNVKFVDWKTYASNNLHYFAKKREMSEWFAKAWKMGRDDQQAKKANRLNKEIPFKENIFIEYFWILKTQSILVHLV